MWLVWLNILAVLVGLVAWWRHEYNGEWVKCLFRGGHDIPKTDLVHELGALFHGGICARCKTFKLGEFVCNTWDESKTEVRGDITHLRGRNPLIDQGGFRIIGDIERLQEAAVILQKRQKIPETKEAR